MKPDEKNRRDFLILGGASLAAATVPVTPSRAAASPTMPAGTNTSKGRPGSSIIRSKSMITGVKNRTEVSIVEGGAVLQRDGIIAEVDTFERLRQRFPDAPVIGSGAQILFPGFVNSHHHVGLTPLQLGSPDMPLELWMATRLGSRFVDPYLDTLYSAFELLESGVTTVQHLKGSLYGASAKEAEKNYDEVIRAYNDVGMRVSFSHMIRDQGLLVYGDDQAFAATLKEPLQKWAKDRIAKALPLADNLAIFDSMHRRYAGHPRVRIQLAPANLHWCSDVALRQLADASEKYQVPMHMHLLETKYQRAYAFKRSGGKTAFAHIAEFGLAGPRLTLGHGVWLSKEDIDRVADSGTSICRNCSSNMRLRSGLAALQTWEKRGVNIGMGIDEAGINDDRDMLQEMRLVLQAHRVPGHDPEAVPVAAQVFRMATAGGARTTAFGNEIGEIRVGAAADLVLVDWDGIAYPFIDERVPLITALVQRAKTRDVSTVICAGEVVYRDGQFTRINRKEILAVLHDQMNRPLTDGERAEREIAVELLPEYMHYYRRFES
jgi:5-methylthioadenosine/S-adenosylhomocysteine deaminase